MASKASREAAKQKAIRQVTRLFSRKTRSPLRSAGTASVADLLADVPLNPKDLPPITSLLQSEDQPQAVAGPSKKVYDSTSLCCLRPARGLVVQLSFWWSIHRFDAFILLTIMANCATMAWQSPLDPPGTWKAAFIDAASGPTSSSSPSNCW